MKEPLTEQELNDLEAKTARAMRVPRGPGVMYIDARLMFRLLQQARRAPLPAVDRGLDELAYELDQSIPHRLLDTKKD